MPYVLIVIFLVKQNILIMYCFNLILPVTKTSHMWKNHLIFLFCIFIIDVFSVLEAFSKRKGAPQSSPPLRCLSLWNVIKNNFETVKGMNFAAFKNYSLEIFIPNLIFLTRPSPHILVKTQTGVFPIFRFLVKSLTNKIYHKSRTSNGIDIKLGPVTELDMKNTTMSNKFDDDFVSGNYYIIVFFLTDGWFRAIRNPDSGRMVCNCCIFINRNLLSNKNWNQN